MSLQRALLALLYALGLNLTLLYSLELLDCWQMAAMALTGMSAAAAVCSLNRRGIWLGGGIAAAAAVLWLATGGVFTVQQTLIGLQLHFSGLSAALPLVAQETALLSSVVCMAAALFVTQRSAGAYPSLVLLLLVVVLVWMFDVTQALWCLLPSVVAAVALMLLGEHAIQPLRVMPLAVTAVAVSFLGVAVGGAAIPAMKEAADDLRQRIYDIFFFTGAREEFSLADVGYYPQGEGQLGGPADPMKGEIMAVITPRKVYLRGVIRNTYTGRSWVDTTQSKRYLWSSLRFREERENAFDMALPGVTDPAYGQLLSQRKITVRMLTGSASSLFVPQRIRQLTTEGDLTPYFNAGSEIFATRNLAPGDVWVADAPLFVGGESGVGQLIRACEPLADPQWEDVNRDYRALPDHIQQEVYDIAWAAIGDAETPYEKALALQYHLQTSYRYTLDAPYQPTDQDFVATFLVHDQAGYCTHFASAMTVLCRMVGLPARYVEGFVATPDATGMAVVTGEEGHAWTEIYFKGFGWLTFDATPSSGEVTYMTPEELAALQESQADASTPAPETPVPTNAPTPTPAPDEATPTASPTVPSEDASPSPPAEPSEPPKTEEPDSKPQKPPFPWWLVLSLGTLLALLGRVLWKAPAWQARRQKSPEDRWLTWAQASHDALRQMGLERRADETPMAFLARVDEARCIPQPMTALAETESLMFYGHAAPREDEVAQARDVFDAIWQQLTNAQQLCMTLQRAFLPRRSPDITIK